MSANDNSKNKPPPPPPPRKAPRNSRPLTAGQAVDKLRQLRATVEHEAEQAYRNVIAGLGAKEDAVRARVPSDELPILEAMLTAIGATRPVSEPIKLALAKDADDELPPPSE